MPTPRRTCPPCCSRSGPSLAVRSADGVRDLPVADVLLGPFTTALGPQELVTDVVVPIPSAGSGSAYASVEHPASGFALVGAAALVGPHGRDGGADRRRRDAVRPRRRSRERHSRRRDLRRPLRVGGVPPRARHRARRARARERSEPRERGSMSDTVIGVARPRIDAPDKVTGATRYAADGYVHGLLHARPVLATEAHARIRGVDGSAALAVPGVVAVLTAADLPITSAGTDRTSEPLAREEVVFAGQPVALVVAETEAAAEDGAEAVVVDYEPLEAVVDVEAAMEVGAAARTHRRGDGRRGGRPGVDPRRRRPRPGGRSRGAAVGERARPHHARAGRRRGGVRRERGGGRGDVPDAVGLPGVSRATGLHRLARAVGDARRLDEHAGLVRHAARGRPGVRPSARARSGRSRSRSEARSEASSRSSSRSRSAPHSR